MSIEKRVSLVEQKVTQILEKTELRPQKPGWIAKVIGSFAECPEFDEVIRLGSEFRQELNVAEDHR